MPEDGMRWVRRALVVSIICPFCSGTTVLLRQVAHYTRRDLVTKFRGTATICPHPRCGRSFAVRRHYLAVTSDSSIHGPLEDDA